VSEGSILVTDYKNTYHIILRAFSTENELYPVIARFVVSKPSMDLSDIPLFYWLLHSSSARVGTIAL